MKKRIEKEKRKQALRMIREIKKELEGIKNEIEDGIGTSYEDDVIDFLSHKMLKFKYELGYFDAKH